MQVEIDRRRNQSGFERKCSLYNQPRLDPRQTRGGRPHGGLHERFPPSEI